jgi:hypothetical protein
MLTFRQSYDSRCPGQAFLYFAKSGRRFIALHVQREMDPLCCVKAQKHTLVLKTFAGSLQYQIQWTRILLVAVSFVGFLVLRRHENC